MKQDTKNSPKPADPAKDQTSAFEQGTALFQQGRYADAKEWFAQAAAGPATELAHSAQMYARMCERRLGQHLKPAQTAEEHYTIGVTQLNRGDLAAAEAALRKALELKPEADHCHYTLALCLGQRGDVVAAAHHLGRAIELQPANRIAALNDPDFHSLTQQPALREVLQGERNNAG
ncbi:MAG: tetratricopeptide repeat protein [Bryobacterales bacterium]|nr:tetratricopeptide repeat protein [Bryobacterales bacterium]